MTEIILHHYDRSPFSEKVRLALGYKRLSWRSVQIPRWMPKPELMPLTGGYRRTPVMQIGADIYCDTRLILREIERRHPTPPLYGAGGGELIAAWADAALFSNAVGVIFGTLADQLPEVLREDRRKMSGGAFDAERMKAAQPAIRGQFRANLRMAEAAFADGRRFLAGAAPEIGDFALFHIVWFITLNVKELDLLAATPAIRAWYDRMLQFGHGTVEPLEAKAALAIAAAATPEPLGWSGGDADSGLKPGDPVTVTANDYARDPVAGTLVAASAAEIVIARQEAGLGTLHVHVPRLGFDLAKG
jgi:glutathione S-transferase